MHSTTRRDIRNRLRTPALLAVLHLAVFAGLAGAANADGDGDSDGDSDSEQWEQALEEVFQSDLVFPQERGEIQITLGASGFEREEGDRLQVPLTLEYGITDRFQVELEWDGYLRDRFDDEPSADGYGDAEIGIAYSWMAIHGSGWHAAAGFELPVELGDAPLEDDDEEEEEGEEEVAPFFVLARDLPGRPGSQISLNGGVEIGGGETEWFGNLVGFVPVRSWVLTAEINWTEEESYFTPGVVWHPGGEWELGAGFPIGLDGEADDWRWIATVTYEIEPRG